MALRIIAFNLCSLLGMSFAVAQEAPAPFKLSIVPSRSYTEERTITQAENKPDAFHVVLTNTSDQAQPVWLPWYSWGYWTISFELTMPDGARHLVRKTDDVGFSKNIPGTFLVPVGEPYVYTIRFDKDWVDRPKVSGTSDIPISLKAIYEVRETPESTRLKVWTGQIESRSYDFTLRHW
jgi:hypothetical protein